MELTNAVAIVSGGASGLGAASVRRLIDVGARVVIADLNEQRGIAFAKELGDAAQFCQTDVADPIQVQAAVDRARELGSLRVAVNCAGIGWAARVINKQSQPHDLDAFAEVVRVNLIGTFNLLRIAAATMATTEPTAARQRGIIINTASVAAFEGQIGQIAYAASKSGIVGMTLPAARDLAPVGIRVCTIAPGIFDTPLLGTLPETAREALAASVVGPKRLGDPDDLRQARSTHDRQRLHQRRKPYASTAPCGWHPK